MQLRRSDEWIDLRYGQRRACLAGGQRPGRAEWRAGFHSLITALAALICSLAAWSLLVDVVAFCG